MEIISHRGFWKKNIEKNTLKSFLNSFENGFGCETDIRDYVGKMKISHDMAKKTDLDLVDFFELYKSKSDKTIALNIKSDGLQNSLKKLINDFKIENYFVFDMSFPDTLNYLDLGLKFFIRESEYELDLPLYSQCSGIWLDCFNSIWYDKEKINYHLDNSKKIAIVSSELHHRDYKKHWKILKDWGISNNENIILCTDFPLQANSFFNLNK